MKAIEKMVEYLRHKEATAVLFQSVWQDAKLEALRLAAEEKAGQGAQGEQMNIEEAKAKITELTEEIHRLRKRDGVIVVRAEEKAGDEGLREALTEIDVQEKDDGFWLVCRHGALLLREHSVLLQSFLQWKERRDSALSRQPVSEQKAPAGLVEELEGWSSECSTRGPDGEPDGCPGMMKFNEILSRYRPCADRTEELVKRLREWQARPDRDDIRAWIEFNEILADFEKGAS